jgi:hypothetical protein
MDHEAADRISAAAAAEPDTARSGFDDRAQDAADRNDPPTGWHTVEGPASGGTCGRRSPRLMAELTRPRRWWPVDSAAPSMPWWSLLLYVYLRPPFVHLPALYV